MQHSMKWTIDYYIVGVVPLDSDLHKDPEAAEIIFQKIA